eukprot:3059749-Rhodomonas_salina.4
MVNTLLTPNSGIHQQAIQGVQHNAQAMSGTGIAYAAYDPLCAMSGTESASVATLSRLWAGGGRNNRALFRQVQTPLSAYALAMLCPVLTYGVCLSA